MKWVGLVANGATQRGRSCKERWRLARVPRRAVPLLWRSALEATNQRVAMQAMAKMRVGTGATIAAG